MHGASDVPTWPHVTAADACPAAISTAATNAARTTTLLLTAMLFVSELLMVDLSVCVLIVKLCC
jgi:hypothetical protein